MIAPASAMIHTSRPVNGSWAVAAACAVSSVVSLSVAARTPPLLVVFVARLEVSVAPSTSPSGVSAGLTSGVVTVVVVVTPPVEAGAGVARAFSAGGAGGGGAGLAGRGRRD